MNKSTQILLFVLALLMLAGAWFCALVEITTLVSYHHPFTAGEIFAWVTANGYEVGDIASYCLRFVWPYWVLCSLATVALIIGVIYLYRRFLFKGSVAAFFLSFAILSPFILIPTRMNLLREGLYAHQQIHAIVQHKEDNASFMYRVQRTDTTTFPEIYVLAIGESVCYSHLSLNGQYGRRTTPLLEQQDSLLLFSDYYANSTLTQHAMPMLLTPAISNTFRQHYQYKTIAEAFNESGFTTALISHCAQLMNNGYHNYLAKDFDTAIFVAHDSLIAPSIERLAHRENKLFIVTNYLGNHMFYTNRTEDCLVWRPDYNTDARFKSDSLFLNAYDNSILYTDRILNSELEVLKNTNAVSAWLFISDHGEYISPRVSGHGHTYHPTKDEYHVPLMIWVSDEYTDTYPEKVANMIHHKDEPVCADHVFWSVLDMADIHIDSTLQQEGMSIFGYTLLPHQRALLLPDGKSVMDLD